MTLDIHLRSLESLRRSITLEQFEKAVDSIAGARRILVFGIGPSSAIADYLVVQLGRFGLDAASLPITSAGRFSPLGPRGMFYRRGNL
jgi:DNA-binding MurR/RpiR family transcriptional regulator